MRIRTVMIGLLGAATVLLAACGGGGEEPRNTSGAAGASTVTTITMTDDTFSPADATVAAGAISLMNDGAALHNLSIEGTRIDHDVAAGETETEDLELAPGSYTMFCKYHRTQGMEGTLTVA
jgi:plastocyanin